MPIQATNNFVLIIRDEAESETGGLIIPDQGKVKPHVGTIFSVGKLTKDPDIKAGKGKKCLFHQHVGFTIDYEGVDYLVLLDAEIISLV